MKTCRHFALLLLSSFLVTGLAAAQSFDVTDVGSLDPGGAFDISYGYGVNSSGAVVGMSWTSTLAQHAFLWTPTGGIQDLGTLGGTNSTAWGINDNGQVVGQADLANGETHAFLWTKETGMQDLGLLGGRNAYAHAINKYGQVVGYAFLPNGNPHAFSWTKATGMVDLGVLYPGSSIAYAINDIGQIVGASSTRGGNHAFLWTKSAGMKDLGSFTNYDGSVALGINNNTHVVGYSGQTELFQYTWGFLWLKPTGLEPLPFLSGSIQNFPMAINNANQITGQYNDGNGFPYAFLYSRSSGIQDLNTLIPANTGWILEIGSAISQNNQITGWGTVTINGNAINHAFLLTPAP